MKKKKKRHSLEDLLDGPLSEGGEQIPVSDEDRVLASRLRILIRGEKDQRMETAEKESLWERIQSGMLVERQSLWRRRWVQVAAVLTVTTTVVGYYLVLFDNEEGSMRRIAATTQVSGSSTQLILGDQRTIRIEGEESAISYLGKEGSIQVDQQSVEGEQNGRTFNTVVVPYGKRSKVTLHDGTRVWLNSGSKLVYPAHFTGTVREVYLEGEAYFSVTHRADQPFVVQSEGQEVKVLGTEFDVSSYPEDGQTSTVLASGSIQISVNKNALWGTITKTMIPGTRAIYSATDKGLKVNRVHVEEFTAWKEGFLVLKSTPLKDILRKLERYYRVEVALADPSLGEETFSGELDLKDDIASVMDIICATTSLNYKNEERRYLFERK